MMQFVILVSVLPFVLGSALHQQMQHPTGSLPAFCHGLDCPMYTVERTYKAGYELRHYQASKWAATNLTTMEFTEDDNRAMFYRLFQYISGNNSAHVKINMTAPVLREVFHGPGPTCASLFVMHFMIPFGNQMNVQKPTDPKVYIRDMPDMKVFVRSFGGRPQSEDYMRELQTLADQIDDPSLYHDMYYFFAGYDGPYTINHRHNEVWLVANAN